MGFESVKLVLSAGLLAGVYPDRALGASPATFAVGTHTAVAVPTGIAADRAVILWNRCHWISWFWCVADSVTSWF